ncbi:MAG: hypothetical protein GWP17_02615 [Aquificales bacterium]|nr:hypothetical protein [Aquificales bacterium]
MTQQLSSKFTHTDIELLRLRLSLTPGQRLQAMFDARFVLVGMIRGRLRPQYPNLPDAELNLKVLEEIERAQSVKSWSQSVSRHPA